LTIEQQIARYAKLTLPLEPELGRCMMPLHEVLSLAPGSVIKLPRPLGSDVDVRVGGAPFGTAEMVRVGGVLSVRLASFHSNKEE
jgi:flagellar motor switch/type III secretory pathway protein FliN